MQKARYTGMINKGLSGNVWRDCPIAEIQQDPSAGFFLFDDFRNFGPTTAVAANVGRYAGLGGAFKSWEDTGGSIGPVAAESTGVIRLATSTTDNDSMALVTNNDISGLFTFNTPANSGNKFWLEARLRLNQIVTGNFCFGMIQVGTAADNGQFTDAGAFADKSFAGFCIKEAASATLDATHRLTGSAETTFSAGVKTIVATTYYKLGLRFDPATGLEYYVDNVKKLNSSSVGYISPSSALFPAATSMLPVFAIKNSSAVLNQLDIDWVAVAGERP